MKWRKVFLLIVFFAIGVILIPKYGFPKIPEPDNIFFGTVTFNGILVDCGTGTVNIKINGSSNPIASYIMGSIPEAGNKYILKVPLDALDPQKPGTARPGDEAGIYYNDKLAETTSIGERGSINKIDIDIIDPTIVDTDGDGLPDIEEQNIGANPNNPDTDGDGLSDGNEFYYHCTDPLLKDTDGDGLSDGDEFYVHGTDPLLKYTDGDCLSDGWSRAQFRPTSTR